MSDTLTALDATFLELEQQDEGALDGHRRRERFRPGARGRSADDRGGVREPGGAAGSAAALLAAAVIDPDGRVRLAELDRRRSLPDSRPRRPRRPAGAGRARGAVRVGGRLLFAPARPDSPAVGNGTDRGARRRSLGDRPQDPSLPRRWRRLRRCRLRAARHRAEPARASARPAPTAGQRLAPALVRAQPAAADRGRRARRRPRRRRGRPRGAASARGARAVALAGRAHRSRRGDRRAAHVVERPDRFDQAVRGRQPPAVGAQGDP